VAHLARPGAPGRAEAVEALAQLVSRESAPAIAALLTDDRAELRATAARALGRLRHEPAAGRLEALRSDYHGRVRRAAVEAIAKLPAGGGPRARR
jgi:HEAT repeat protein